MNHAYLTILFFFLCSSLVGQTLDPTFSVQLSPRLINCPIDSIRIPPTFKEQINVFYIEVQTDGKTVINGSFSAINGIPKSHLARIQMDGSLDTSFNYTLDTCVVANRIFIQPDGRIITSISGYWDQDIENQRLLSNLK